MAEISKPSMLAQIQQTGQVLHNRLQESFGQHPFVGDIRGRGLFWGLEFVADRDSKQAFDPNLQLAKKFKQIAFDRGLMIYPMSGTIDGIQGDHILLAPPYIFGDSHLDELMDKLHLTIEDAVQDL
jgi:adenosylmethionine-8-amino-7-oxononanoate aminotransferase